MARLPAPPDLTWTEEGAPRARAYDDIYFSRAGGLEETRAVFLRGCGLPERWARAPVFSILELGFGAGLNMAAAWAAWDKTHAPGARLHFVSVEAAPLAAADAARALGAFPELAPYAARLIAAWPVRARGAQRIWFGDFALTLICAEAEEALAGLEAQFDAVFLDGFSPARNPAMWTPALMRRIAQLCAPAARLATYSVASGVRRALEEAGFAVEKHPGFAAKRERLEARLARPAAPAAQLWPYARAVRPSRIAIVGGGIAGASTAAAFLRRGLVPTLYDSADSEPAPAALVTPRLDRDELAPARLYRAAYIEALRTYEALGALEAAGVEERPADPRDAALLADVAADPPLEDALLVRRGEGLFHPRAGFVRPAALIARLAEGAARARARIVLCTRAAEGWRLEAEDGGVFEADIVVLCAGAGLGGFAQTRWLPLAYSRGQIDWGLSAERPAHVIVAGGYAAPLDGCVLFGATFDRTEEPQAAPPDEAASARNRAALARLTPACAASLAPAGAWAGVRASTNDRMPIAGLLPDAPAWAARFASLKDGRAPAEMAEPPPAHAGLYALGALGARGFSLAPILGERIAAEALGEPQTLDRGVLAAIHPARFLIRALKRGQKLDF